MFARILLIFTLFLPFYGQAQSAEKQLSDSTANRTIYLKNTYFSGLKYVYQGEVYKLGSNHRNILAVVQPVPVAYQEIQLANKYTNKAGLYSLVGTLGGLGLFIAGSSADNNGLMIAGAGVFSVSTFISFRYGIKSFNSLNKGIWLYNQQVYCQ